jgi:REP element-mobilizing transposase RayT
MLKPKTPYWPNNRIYFLTGSTFLHYPYFRTEEQKQILLNQIIKVKKNFNIPISAFSIAINHYHIKFYLKNGLYLSKIKQLIHGGTTFIYKKKFKMKYSEMWQTSKTICITSEIMNWKVTAYIIGNLLKHKEVNTFEELKNNPFSSYRYFIKKYGDEFARKLIYNVINVNENAEGEIDFESLRKTKFIKPF